MKHRRVKEESLIKKLIQVRRVCKVTEGGSNFSFSALVVVGDGNGSASIAMGKSQEISEAVKKAFEKASSKKFDFFPLKQKRTVHHEIKAKYCASKILVKPVKKGSGIKVGKVLAPYCEAIGLKEVTIKIFGSRNPANSLKALRAALLSVQTERHRNNKRGIIDEELNKSSNPSKFSENKKQSFDKKKGDIKHKFSNKKDFLKDKKDGSEDNKRSRFTKERRDNYKRNFNKSTMNTQNTDRSNKDSEKVSSKKIDNIKSDN